MVIENRRFAVHQLLHPTLARESVMRAASPIAIRTAEWADVPALERLAALETAPAAAVELAEQAHNGDVLVAESGGRVVAALTVRDGLAVADPFVRTAGLVRLLRAHASQLARERRRRGRSGLPVLRPRLP
jgi:hypothetical protein